METNENAPAYLSPALHGDYNHLVDQLSPVTRYRDAAIIARALHEGYRRGRVDALADLLTTEQVAAELGLTAPRIRALAQSRNVGWKIGRDYLFRPEDVAALRVRIPGRPRKPPAP
jgi:hypothetical protein